MPEAMSEVYQILIDLKLDWAAKLQKQTKVFEDFISKSNTSARRLENSISSMQKNINASYENMFKGSQKQLDAVSKFAQGSVKGISTSATRILQAAEKRQEQHVKFVEKNIKRLYTAEKRLGVARTQLAYYTDKGVKEGPDFEAAKAKVAKYEKLYENLSKVASESIGKVSQSHIRKVAEMLAHHYSRLSKGVLDKTKAVSQATNLMISDTIKKFNILKGQTGLMGRGVGEAQLSRGIRVMETQAKNVFANLRQLSEAHATAQKAFSDQIALRDKAAAQVRIAAERGVSKERYNILKQTLVHHDELVQHTKLNLEKIQQEYFETAKSANKLTQVIREQKAELAKRSTGIYQSMRKDLEPGKIKSLFASMFDNLRQQASLAGKGLSDELAKSVGKGDQLRGKLDAFKNKLEEIKQVAAILVRQGLIDPEKIEPKIKRAENMLKQFGNTYKQLAKDLKFQPKSLAQFRMPELGDLRKVQGQIKDFMGDLQKIGNVNKRNWEDTYKNVNKLEQLWDKEIQLRKQAAKKIHSIRSEANRVERQMAETHDAAMRQQMNAHINKLRDHAGRLEKILRKPMPFDRTVLRGWQSGLESTVQKTISRVSRLMNSAKLMPTLQLNSFKEKYTEAINLINKASQKRLFRSASVDKAEAAVKKLVGVTKLYRKQIQYLEQELKRLEAAQAKGFRTPGIRTATRELRQHIQTLKSNMAEVTSSHNHAVRRMSDLKKTASKGIFRTGWEAVRNFRWQVAAVIYLVQRAIWAVTNTIGKMFREIAMFRQTAMALAAQFSFKTVGSINDNFDQLYQYSRNLLERLQLEAARTILTFEDMMMLTKTLAQAGIIPKTDEDVKRISTIGVAIKTLTEGMANAGVQMRQELYAVIVGRQRATDQLGMMFKVMGVNIQEMIDQARAAGKDLDVVLADALKPFSALNKAMENEFNTVVNRLKVYWQIIQRIGGEDVLQNFTKSLANLADSLYNMETGNLTDLGKKIAAGINVALNILMEFGNTLKVMFASWWDAASTMYSAFADILSAVGLINKESLGVNKQWSALKVMVAFAQGVFITIANVFRMISLYTKTLYTYMKVIVTTWIAVGKLITKIIPQFSFIKSAAAWIVDNLPGAFKKVYDWITGIFSKFAGFVGKILEWFGDKLSKTDAGKEFVDTIKGNVEDVLELNKAWDEGVEGIKHSYDGIGDSLNQIDKIQQHVNKGLEYNFEEMLKLPYRFEQVMEQARPLGGDLGQMEMKALTGLEKVNAQARQRIEKYQMLEMMLTKNINRLETFLGDKRNAMTPDQRDALEQWLAGHKKVYGELLEYYKFVKEAQANETEKYYIKMAKQERTYKQWMREALMVPETPKEKATAWMEKMKIDLKALAMENKFFKDNYDKVLDAIEKGGEIRTDIAIKEMNLEAQKFIDKASKADAWNNVFDELNIEFSQYVTQIEKSTKLDEKKKIELTKQLEVIKEQRRVQEKLNIAYDAYVAQQDIVIKKAEYMRGSFSPIKQREGEIMALSATHNKEMKEMQKKIDEFNNKWRPLGQWVKDADDNVKALGKSYDETMQLMTQATKRELQKKQMPIWNDLVEASKGWADGFTDALSEIVVGVDSVSEALQQLQQQILKDVVKTMIKRTITDNLMDALGTGFMGEETPLQRMFGGGKKGKGAGEAQEITASKPIPVTVYNAQDLMDSTVKTITPMEKLPLPGEEIEVGMGMRVFVTNWPIGEGGGLIGGSTAEIAAKGVQGVSQDLSDISSEIAENTAAAEESTKSWYSGITDVFSSIGNWFSNLFSGGGSGGGGSNMAGLAQMGMQMGSYFMADGGVISEPVIGKGLESGKTYNFGERAKYGESEIVAPMKKLQKSAPGSKVTYNMPIHLSAIDTQSGVEFLTKHSDTIQGQLTRNLRKNKPVRKGIQNSF
jgi:hypothetical protein